MIVCGEMAIRINDTSSILSHIKRSRPYKVSRPHRRRCILLASNLLISCLLPSCLLAILLLPILLPFNLLLGGLRLWGWVGVGV